jgi:hypothetical protein
LSRASITRSNAAVIESECGRRAERAAAGAGAGAGAAGWAAAAAGRDAGAGIAGGGEAAAGTDFDDFDDAGGGTGALGAGGDAGDRAPRGCAGVGAGGGDTTIVGSRSLVGGVRGTLGNAPPRAGVRGSGGAAGGGGSPGEDDEDDAGARSPARRGSRCAPGHSQIERGDSADGFAVLAGVANAGVSPGAAALYNGGGAGSSTGGAGAAGAADVAPVPDVSSGSSFIALPSSSPAEASAGLPS